MKLKTLKRRSTCWAYAAALFVVVQSALAYEPPIGIPDPGGVDAKTGVSYGWGDNHPIDKVAPLPPENWTSQVSGFYYIDPSHRNASDVNNEFGYPNQPRASLPRNFPAGSYVVMAGDFPDSTSIVNFDCTVTQPCWLRGLNPDNMPTILGNINVQFSTYLFIENLNFNGGDGNAIAINTDSHHIVVRSNRVTNRAHPVGRSTGITISPGKDEYSVSDIVLYNNYFDTLGELDVGGDQDFHAMSASTYGRNYNSGSEVSNVWALSNHCSAISGDCFQVTGIHAPNSGTPNYERLHHIYIGDNVSFNNRQGGVGVKEAEHVIVSQNISYDNEGDNNGNAGGCFGYQYQKSNVWFLFNECHDSVFGIRQSDTENQSAGEDVYMIGNLIYNIRPSITNPPSNYSPRNPWHQGAGIALWHGNLDRFIVDNTIYGVEDGINAIYRGGVNISGNIIADIGSVEYDNFFTIHHPASYRPRDPDTRELLPYLPGLESVDYNLFFDEARQSYETWSTGGIVDSISGLQDISRVPYCQEFCDFADPLFVNPTRDPQSRDFHLQAGSPAIAANIKHPAYDRFQELYGLNIYKDFDGNDRDPINPTIGAFEYIDGDEGSNTFDLEKLLVKINYPTKNQVYTPSNNITDFQFGGHASYEGEITTLDWVLAQCTSDCAQELAEGGGNNSIVGSTQTERVAAFPDNNWDVDNQALFPGRNIVIVSAVLPNGQMKTTSLIIEPASEPEPVVGLPSVQLDTVYSTSTVTVPDNVNQKISGASEGDNVTIYLSGTVADDERIASMRWSCIALCTGRSLVKFSNSNWRLYDITLGEGNNRIRIEATDVDGNTVSEEYEITL